jgi:isoquinoline 1-oxidoreductase beta subunit
MKKAGSSIERRDFIRITGLTGAGLFLGLRSIGKGLFEPASMMQDAAPGSLTPFVHVEPSGKIIIYNIKPEIGQGTWQSVPTMIAEELEVPLEQVDIRNSNGAKIFGEGQSVGGSYSIRGHYQQMRGVGAAAREMLITAAAAQWGVPAGECYADNARIHHRPSGKSVGYGELADAAAKLPVPKEPKLKDHKDFKQIGKAVRRPDVPLKSSGRAVFGIDAEVPGMVYASVLRSPVFGSKLVSVDDAAARQVKGVIGVERCERIVGIARYEGIAVIAENYWAALQGRRALKATWDHQGKDRFNSVDFEKEAKALSKQAGLTDHTHGDFDKAFSAAPVKLEAYYETPFAAHAPMEPMNCTAHWQAGDIVDIWTSTQVPDDIMSAVPGEFKIPAENVRLHMHFNGGGFGRRLISDYVLDAVLLSKKTGRPVKLIWTREDDMEQGPFRPPTFSALRAGLSADGKPLALEHKVISPSIGATLYTGHDTKKVDKTMTEALGEQEYEIPNIRSSYVYMPIHVPLLYWRAVTSTTLAFSHECFLDEMAVRAKQDPMAFRLAMVKKGSDTERVLLKLKEVSNWDRKLPAGWGRGVAQYNFFAGLCGQVVEVSRQGQSVKIEKVYAVIDMGTVVNPDTVKGQVEGAIAMAISAAIKPGITFDKGRTQQSNFNNYPVLRIHEMPLVEVHILANGGPTIKGAGEPGLPPLAPALCNAIFAASGKRIRRLPFDINAV